MISVAPAVVDAVDVVSINERGVAAAVSEGGSVSAWGECDRGTAVSDGRQGGGEDFRETVNRSGVVGGWVNPSGLRV